MVPGHQRDATGEERMIHHLARRVVPVLWLVAAIALVAACAGAGPSPDPGNRLLHGLAADPVFARLPPGAVRTSWQEQPAQYRSSWFEGGGWDGPAVILTFTSAQQADEVYRFYAERAAAAGWSPYQKLANGLTRSWFRLLDGKRVGINLFANWFNTPGSYALSGFGPWPRCCASGRDESSPGHDNGEMMSGRRDSGT